MKVGRLYWKFFFFIWLAQVAGIIGTAVTFWVERQQDHARWVAATGGQLPPEPPWAAGHPPPPPDGPRPLPPHGGRPPPPRPPHLPLVPLFAAFAASLASAALLAWYFSKPIRNMRSAFDAAAAGDLDVRVSPSMGRRRDELADLGRDFDRMASRLHDLLGGQRRLLHDVSHELRSPLARLQAAIGLLRQQPARLEDSLQRIERESVRMDCLVGELLTLSRLEAGVTPPMDEKIPVDELLGEIVSDASFEAETSGRSVALHINAESIVRGNGELLQRAVENVVRNAIRHTAPGSTVVLEAEPIPHAGRVRLAVLDAGPGAPEGELAAIFEPFYRSGEARDSNGYGLGLALARRAVEAHGGSIKATNRPEGGLCVEIELPMI